MNTIYIGATPCDEECEQLGSRYRPAVARLECQVFIEQLTRAHPPANAACSYRIKAERHDFGTYYEVIARVDPSYVLTDEERAKATRWMYDAECGPQAECDEEAGDLAWPDVEDAWRVWDDVSRAQLRELHLDWQEV